VHQLSGYVAHWLHEAKRLVVAIRTHSRSFVVVGGRSEGEVLQYEVPNFPASPERGSHTIFFSRVFYIDRSDFRLEDSADFYRLTPQKEVGLRYFKPSGAKDDEYYLIKYKSHKADESGRVTDLEVEIVTHTKKPKAHYIQFVAQPEPGVDPKLVEFRIYEDLFKVDNPSALTNETWEAAINPNSLVIATGFVDPFAASTSIYHHHYNCTRCCSLTHSRTHAAARVYDKFQFERLGYFTTDLDSNDNELVFNRIVPL